MATLYSDFNSRDALNWVFGTLNTSRHVSCPAGELSSVNCVSFCRSWKSGYGGQRTGFLVSRRFSRLRRPSSQFSASMSSCIISIHGHQFVLCSALCFSSCVLRPVSSVLLSRPVSCGLLFAPERKGRNVVNITRSQPITKYTQK